MNYYTFSDITIGMTESFTCTITEKMENEFRNISGDTNPLHKDDEYAVKIGNGRYKKHVVFGMLTASFYSTMAGVYLPGKYSLIHSFEEISFLRPVYRGDMLIVKGEVYDKIESLKLIRLKVQIKNKSRQEVSRAKIKVLVLK